MASRDFDKVRDGFLSDKRVEQQWETHGKYKSVLNVFGTWLDESDVDALEDLESGDLHDFKRHCRNARNNKEVSVNGTMTFLTVFLAHCEDVNAVKEGLSDKVPVPEVSDDEEVCEDMPDDDHMEAVLEYHRTHEPTSRTRVELELAAEGLLRRGAMQSIDEDDHNPKEQDIALRHRPEGDDGDGTTLKNGPDGERIHNLSERLNKVIDEHIEKRDSVEDDVGRTPLLATDYGRASKSTITRDFYKATRPCKVGLGCPHDRDIDECKATKARHASKCPSSYSPHPIRRWGIVDHLDQGVPIGKVSDRTDTSLPVLKKHYDPFAEERAKEGRKESLHQHHDAFGNSENQTDSESQGRENESQRPVDAVVKPFLNRMEVPILLQWFMEDLEASRTDNNVIRTKVKGGVAVYCVATVLLKVGLLLTTGS